MAAGEPATQNGVSPADHPSSATCTPSCRSATPCSGECNNNDSPAVAAPGISAVWLAVGVILPVVACLCTLLGWLHLMTSLPLAPYFDGWQQCFHLDYEQLRRGKDTSLLKQCRYYVLMIDAGSTGTRLHVLQFAPSQTGSTYRLLGEDMQEVKPGLSSFAQNVSAAADSLEPLLQLANATVPAELHPHTPLALRATAGLRLLDTGVREAILKQTFSLFSSFPFSIDSSSSSMLTGTDEGIYAWFTLNYLLDRGRLDQPRDPNGRLAIALDLGGASTQITYRPFAKHWAATPAAYRHELRLPDHSTVQLYTHSYLGNGLIEARLRTLQLNQKTDVERHRHEHEPGLEEKLFESHTTNGTSHSRETKVYSACFPPHYQLAWTHHHHYVVHGRYGYGYEACAKEVEEFVNQSEIHAAAANGYLAAGEVYGFSYFYERTKQSGLIDGHSGRVRISRIRHAAQIACLRSAEEFSGEHWRPWQCFDLTYVYALLTKGYHFSPDREITMIKKIEGKEVSWALGAAHNLLTAHLESHQAANKPSWLREKWTSMRQYFNI